MDLLMSELEAFSKDHGTRMITDQVFNRHVLLMGLREKEKPYPGGLNIRELLLTEEDNGDITGRAIPGKGAFEVKELEAHTAALFQEKYYVQTIPIWTEDIVKNGGSNEQFWSFFQARTSVCAKFMQARFARHLYSRGQNTDQINGLPDLIDNTGSMANINRSTYDWWRAYVDRVAAGGAGRKFSTRPMGKMISQLSDGNIRPDVIISTTDMYDAVEATLADRERYPKNNTSQLAQAGFEAIEYRSVPIIYDKYCSVLSETRHPMWYLNFDHLQWRPVMNLNMKRTAWMRMPRHLGEYMLVIWVGNVTTNAPRRLGVVHDNDPALTT